MKPKKEPKYKKANAALRNTIFEKYSKTFAYPTDTWADFKEEFRERGKQRPEINFDIGSNARRYDSYEAGYHDGITDILWHMAALEGYHFGRVDEFRKQQRIKQEQIAEDQKLYDAWIEKTKKEKPKAKKKNDEAPYNWFIDNKGI